MCTTRSVLKVCRERKEKKGGTNRRDVVGPRRRRALLGLVRALLLGGLFQPVGGAPPVVDEEELRARRPRAGGLCYHARAGCRGGAIGVVIVVCGGVVAVGGTGHGRRLGGEVTHFFLGGGEGGRILIGDGISQYGSISNTLQQYYS